MNENPNTPLTNFLTVAKNISSNLQERYKKQWINPNGEPPVVKKVKMSVGGHKIPIDLDNDEEPYEVDLHTINESQGQEQILEEKGHMPEKWSSHLGDKEPEFIQTDIQEVVGSQTSVSPVDEIES